MRALSVHAFMDAGDTMFRPNARIAAAVFVAGVIAFAVTFAPAANEATRNVNAAEQALPQHFAMADHLRVPLRGTACSAHGWPSFEPKCQFDVRKSAREARTVRVIALR